MNARACCVPGCQKVAWHERVFVIDMPGWGGETSADSWFCCEHIDMLNNEEPPFLDLTVIGTVRS